MTTQAPREELLRAEILRLYGALTEKRSDIADTLEHILNGQPWSVKSLESRYITSPVPSGATRVQYDTLTTLLAFEVNGEWKTPTQEEYSEDGMPGYDEDADLVNPGDYIAPGALMPALAVGVCLLIGAVVVVVGMVTR